MQIPADVHSNFAQIQVFQSCTKARRRHRLQGPDITPDNRLHDPIPAVVRKTKYLLRLHWSCATIRPTNGAASILQFQLQYDRIRNSKTHILGDKTDGLLCGRHARLATVFGRRGH
jgi:hypothetical protein